MASLTMTMTEDQTRVDQLRVLVVDDELLIRWSVSEMLSAAGHQVVQAESAAAALGAVSNGNPPDVVVLDYRLPDSADLGLLRTIRERAPRAAVIFMTAYGTPDVVDGALRLGAYQVLSKPFEVSELPRLVADAHAAVRR